MSANAIADWTSDATSFVGGPFSFVSVLLLALLDIIVRERLGESVISSPTSYLSLSSCVSTRVFLFFSSAGRTSRSAEVRYQDIEQLNTEQSGYHTTVDRLARHDGQ